MTNIGTPHPVVAVPNVIVSNDDHNYMIQLSDDSSRARKNRVCIAIYESKSAGCESN